MPAPENNDEFDNLSAWGFVDDVHEEALRRGLGFPARPNRKYNENFSPDPTVWLTQKRMSQTEVSLRLGTSLLKSPVIDSNVVLTLAGHEMTRTERPQFPVTRYLTERLGFAPKVNRPYKWRGHYSLPGAERRLVVTFDRLDGHVSVRLASGNRFIVFVSAGSLEPKAGAERRMLRAAIGRAVAWPGARRTDVLAVCVPRSAAFRKAIAEFRRTEGVRTLGLHLLTVDRSTGSVGGLLDVETLYGRG
jgi:hypothetical protein